jgi:hypothetical protein
LKKAVQRKVLWRLVGAGSALIAGQVIKYGMQKGYKVARGASPPTTPWRKGTGLRSALMWTAVSAVAISLGEVLAEQAAGAGWKRVTGKQPPK